MSKHYIYKMEIAENDTYYGVYIGQHKIGKKDPSCDGYKGSGCRWKKHILNNHIPVEKTVLRLCDNIDEANYWEQFYIEQAIQSGEYLWNVAKGGGAHETGVRRTAEEIRVGNKERCRRWYEANKEHHKEYSRLYHQNNKDRLYSAKRQYEEQHKDFYVEYRKQYYENNKEQLSEKHRQYYEQHKDHLNKRMREYYAQYKITHADQIAEKSKRYNDARKEERKKFNHQPCCYNGEILTLAALSSRLRRQNVSNPVQTAQQYLVNKGEKL